MAGLTRNGGNSLIAFLAGAVAALAIILGFVAWRAGQDGVVFLHNADLLPNLRQISPPRLPDAPRVADPAAPR